MIHQVNSAASEAYFKSENRREADKKDKSKETKSVDSAFIVEVSSCEANGAGVSKLSKNEIEHIRDQVEMTSSSLKNLVEKLLLKQQGNQSYFSVTIQILGSSGEIATTQTDAQQAISENGEWGVNAVSDRIVEFAKSISGNDPSKVAVLKDAIDQGFADAGRTLGRDLPDICGQIYDAIMQKLDAWAYEPSAATAE